MRKQRLLGLLVALGLLSAQTKAETTHGKLWRPSAAVLGAVTIADMQSSVGRQEGNPLLRSNTGRFSGRGVALKSLIVGSAVAGQWLVLRKNPHAAGPAAAMNFAVSAATGAIVVRNHMVK